MKTRKSAAPPQTKASNPSKLVTKKDYTFKSNEEAEGLIIPIAEKVDAMRKRQKRLTVKGWKFRMIQWLTRMERGCFDEHRSPIFHSLGYDKIAKRVEAIVLHDFASKSRAYSRVPWFYKEAQVRAEEHQLELLGPRGCFPPASDWLTEKVRKLFSDYPPPPGLDMATWLKACQITGDKYRKAAQGKKIAVTLSDFEDCFKKAGTEKADQKTLNSKTNSGYPYFVKYWYHAVKDATVSAVQLATEYLLYSRAKSFFLWALKQEDWHTIANKLHFVTIANQRTNVSNGHIKSQKNTYRGHLMSKLRLTCALEKMDTLLGKPILNILIDIAKDIRNDDGSRPYCALTPPAQIDKNIQQMLDTAHTNKIVPLCTDYDGFDEHVGPWMAMSVATAVSQCLEKHTANLYLALVYAETYNTCCIATDCLVPEGPSRRKSGCFATNNCDSNENFTVQIYGWLRGYWDQPLCQLVNGDDAALIARRADPKKFSAVAAEVGHEANVSKQCFIADVIAFCQLFHIWSYPGGVYMIGRSIQGIITSEDDVDFNDLDESTEFKYALEYRNLCRMDVAWANVNFVQFAEMIAANDKLHLMRDRSPQEIARLAGSYAVKLAHEANEKPWKAMGNKNGFASLPINRVLRGDLPPPPGIARWEWARGVKWKDQPL